MKTRQIAFLPAGSRPRAPGQGWSRRPPPLATPGLGAPTTALSLRFREFFELGPTNTRQASDSKKLLSFTFVSGCYRAGRPPISVYIFIHSSNIGTEICSVFLPDSTYLEMMATAVTMLSIISEQSGCVLKRKRATFLVIYKQFF